MAEEFEIKHFRTTELYIDEFIKLPRKAQVLMVDYIRTKENNSFNAFDVSDFYSEFSKSPIEAILKIALDIAMFETNFYAEYIQQFEIEIGKKKYYADFAFYKTDEDGDIDRSSKILVVECDGHDFHEKTKEQVRRNNERDYDLKKSGYDVLHFSGSQIYNDPYSCAKETLEYIRDVLGW